MAERSGLEYTPVKKRRGQRVHAIALAMNPTTAACGATSKTGWIVSPARAKGLLNCKACKLALHFDCRPRPRVRA